MLKLFIRLCQHAFAAVLPPSCPGCMGLLPATEPIGFCTSCYARLPWWNTARLLPPKLPPAITSFTAPCLYEEPLRNAILQLKFHDAVPFVTPLARLLAPHVPQGSGYLLVPVPSHASRLRKRRYNHAALLVQKLTELTGTPNNVTTLRRTVASSPQAQKTRAARLRLPATHFAVAPKHVAGKDIILVDDIYTTGATVRACALCLRKAGATSVHVLTLAYTAPDR